MIFVYILQSLKTKEYYKGLTNNLDQRINEHFNGKCRSTQNKLPFQLVHVEMCNSRKEARKIEKFFKSGYGREIIEEIAEVAKWQTRRV